MLFAQAPTTCCIGASFTTEPGWTTCCTNGSKQSAEPSPDERIAADIGVGTSTVYRTKQHFVEDGLTRALIETARPGAPRKLSAGDEARLVAVACSAPPAGRAHWTLELLAGALVRLTTHETLSSATVGRRLADMKLKPWREKRWCIPTVNAEYVARMEDVLALYAEAPTPGDRWSASMKRPDN